LGGGCSFYINRENTMGGQAKVDCTGLVINTELGKQFIIKVTEFYASHNEGTFYVDSCYKEIEDANFNGFMEYLKVDISTREWKSRERFALEYRTSDFGKRIYTFSWTSRANNQRKVEKIDFIPLSLYPCTI
jgi:hypothetical protein